MEDEVDLREYWRVLVKRKWLIAALFMAAVIASYFASKMMTPVYEAQTTVLIQQQSSLADLPFLEGLASASKNPIQNYVEILKSRSLAEMTVQRMGLGWEIPSPEFSQFRESISVQPVQGTDTVRVSVRSTDPAFAQDAANNLVAAFIEKNRSDNQLEARSAREFIESQLKVVEADLQKAEERVRLFKETEKVMAPAEETKAVLQKLTDLETMRAQTTVAAHEAQVKLSAVQRELERQDEKLISATTIANNPLVQQYKAKLSDLEIQLAGALEQYTGNHPVITRLRAEIEETKRRLNDEVERTVTAQTESLNPIHQGLLQELIGLQAEILALEARQQAIGQLISENEAIISALPSKELELARLLREQSVTEQIYVMLRSKQEEMRITEAMQTANVQTIDPAVTPQTPVSPRVPLNVAIAGFLGLFVGVGLAFLLEYADTTVRTEEQVQELLGLPVLGRIPVMNSPVIQHRRSGSRHRRSAPAA